MHPVAAHSPGRTAALDVDDLESLIRRVVREEIGELLSQLGFYEESTKIEVGSPLYQDLMDIQQRARTGHLEFYTYEQAFDDEAI